MKKRILCAAAIALLAVSARGEERRQRYLVATRTAAAKLAPAPYGDRDLAARGYTRFSSVDGYSLELTDAEALSLSQRPDVRYVEPDRERFVAAGPRLDAAQELTYGVSMVNAPQVWPITRGEGIRVGVIDTGIDLRHVDLQKAYRGGWDFIHDDAIPEEEAEGDAMGHGTRMAGLIAATDDQLGVVGVAPGVSLYALKIFGKTGGALTSNVIRALDWAIEHDLDVLSCSFGGENPSKLEEEAFDRARRADILIVAAVGNHAAGVRSPALYPSVVAVGAIDRSMRIAWFSNTGPALDFVAPGVDVLSTFITGLGRMGTVTLDDSTVLSAYPYAYSKSGLLAGEWVDCLFGGAGDFDAGAKGKIALMERGGYSPANQASNALAHETLAVVVINNGLWDSPQRASLGSAFTNWPVVVSVSASSGERIRTAGGSLTIDSYVADYEGADGTSMSAPLVAGVAALIRALRPDLSAGEVIAIMSTTARDLGAAGWDPVYGNGLVDANAAARAAAPHAFAPRRRATRPGG
jgi:subtilisin family serine protease